MRVVVSFKDTYQRRLDADADATCNANANALVHTRIQARCSCSCTMKLVRCCTIAVALALCSFHGASGAFVPAAGGGQRVAGRTSTTPSSGLGRHPRRCRQHRHCASTSDDAAAAANADADAIIPLQVMESILVDEVRNAGRSADDGGASSPQSDRLPYFLRSNDGNPALAALRRAVEIGTVLGGRVAAPLLASLAGGRRSWPAAENGGWEAFWSGSSPSSADGTMTNARRLAAALELLGPTYVKFGQALGSRPDVVPPSLARALSSLQDDMAPFENDVAKEIIRGELSGEANDGEKDSINGIGNDDLEALLSSLTEHPVAAASIGQVYKARLPGRGDVAVKVQRPDVRRLVERDAELLLAVARLVEAIPAPPSSSSDVSRGQSARLINTELVAATQEFMSRIFEELDYRNEASNCRTFASLYSEKNGSSNDVSVVVPEVYLDWCTENVLVMEWIDGTKLTDVKSTGAAEEERNADGSDATMDNTKENLALVKVAIDSTLHQLLVAGVLHADPHAGNLLKIRRDDGGVTLGYLDFGLMSTIPAGVRDALICSVALQVSERDVDAVAALFGELQLIPQHILDDETERAALAQALHVTFENSLLYPQPSTSATGEEITAIPDLKFDKLLDSLSRLVPRFQFDLPPYFINNARALSTLEGIAKSLDPSFNVLTIMYPYALNRLLQNPSRSPVVDRTLQTLIRSSDGRIDRQKIRRLLRDSALISGMSKRRVLWDVIKTKSGRKLTRSIIREESRMYLFGKRNKRRSVEQSASQR